MSEFGFIETASIRSCPDRDKVIQIVRAALDAVNPYNSVRRIAAVDGNMLSIQGQSYDLSRYDRIFVVGAGKAAFPMAKALQDLLGERVTDGAVIVKDGYLPAESEMAELKKVRIYAASHPIPDQRGINATEEILDLAQLG